MIIQCEKCRTKFRLDDSRVTDKGVKVRCTKCKNVFRVQREKAEVFVEPFEAESTLVNFSPLVAPQDTGDVSPNTLLSDAAIDDLSFGTVEPRTADTTNGQIIATESLAPEHEIDFSGFDFSDSDPEPATAAVDVPIDITADSHAAPTKEILQELDFSDDMFGEVVQSAPETASTPITFDFEEDGFAESMDISGERSNSNSNILFSLDSSNDAPFSLGEIDFGDELTSVAVQQVNPEDLKPSQEILFAPLADAQDKPESNAETLSISGSESSGDHQDLPPLSISSRRKQSPLFSGLIAVVALLIISVLGYFGYSSLSTPKETASQETGTIGVRAVKSVYIQNSTAGELLVISGEALNEYPKPRAALQVKVTVFDSTGQSIATKSAYGGNPLTDEQLKSLPIDKIEAAMANQFGDSLANMEVAPGKAIPFVIVLGNLPKGAKDFAVQSAGSTVATGKQQ